MSKIILENKKITRALSLVSKTFVWALIFSLFYYLRSFALLFFLTFVFSYLQSGLVDSLKGKIANRLARVLLVTLVFWSIIISAVFYITPQFIKQCNAFVKELPVHIANLDKEALRLREQYPVLQDFFPTFDAKIVDDLKNGKNTNSKGKKNVAEDVYDDELVIIDKNTKFNFRESQTLNLLGFFNKERNAGNAVTGNEFKQAVKTLRIASVTVFSMISSFLLSLLFSFLIMLDLPSLKKQVTNLKNTKLEFIYVEVADSIRNFCNTLGSALRAQFYIAICNTFLTFLGLVVLGLTHKAAFLSVIVFACSFIPVVGVIVSSIPICLSVVQVDGVIGIVWTVLLITIIHLIETYILNPRIYGSHLKLNPVIVLIILTICGKLFSIWGLLLGVPIFSYLFCDAIRRNKNIA